MNEEKDKADFIFQHAKARFDDEIERFKNMENKASKFIGLLSIVIFGYTTLIRLSGGVFFPPKTAIDWVTFSFVTLTFLALAASWGLLFRSLKFREMPRLHIDKNYIEEFKKTKLFENQYLIAESFSDSFGLARAANTDKTKPLLHAYTFMSLSACLLLASLILLATTAYLKNGNFPMSEEDNAQQSQQSPSQEDAPATPTAPKVVMVLDEAIPPSNTGAKSSEKE